VLVKGHQVLLTDFGISRDWTELGHSTTTGPTTKTPRYCAPEVAAYKPRNSLSDIWSLGCVFLEIWSVLCGETVSKLTAYMSSSGSCSSCYNQNPDAISSWCDMICSKLGDRELEWPCRWIMSMLEANPKDRCNAQALFERIQEVDADPDVRHSFTGMCCNEEEHTAESVISSDFEHDHIETTDLSSIQSTTVIPSLVSRQELTEQPASTPKLVEVHARQVELLPPESTSRSQNSELASLESGRQATQAADTVEVVPFQSLPGEATSILQATDSYLDGLDLLFAQPDTATQLQTTDSYLDGIDLLFVQPDTSTQLPNGRITSSALEEKHKRLNPSDSTTSFVKSNDEEREKRPTLTVANLNKASPEMNTTLSVLGTTRDANYSYKNKKPYTCLACGQSFRSNSQLHGHLRASEHAVAGVCHTCGLSFASDNHMNKHRSEYRHKVQAARGTHDGPNGSSKPLSDPIGPNKSAIPIANRQPSYSPDSRRSLATTTPTSNYKPENRRLPPGWERRKTDTGKVYYVDHTTMQTAWEIPDSAFNVAFEKTSLPQDGPKKKKSSIWKLFKKKEKNALEA
jgi:serine/threonine protein kinase